MSEVKATSRKQWGIYYFDISVKADISAILIQKSLTGETTVCGSFVSILVKMTGFVSIQLQSPSLYTSLTLNYKIIVYQAG